MKGHGRSVLSVVFSPNGEQLASGSSDKTVKIWDIASGRYVKTLEGYDNCVWSVAFSPNGQQLTCASSDKTIKIWASRLNR